MERYLITFSANEQHLKKTGGIDRVSSDKVGIIDAHFDLGESWTGYDRVSAVWYSDLEKKATVVDAHGNCEVPHEVQRCTGKVRVVLVGTITENDELKCRMTPYSELAFIVDEKVPVEGTETVPVTPSQFDQFVEAVHGYAENAYQSELDAKGYAESAEQSATLAHDSEVNAKGSEDNAKASEQNAHDSEVSASASAQSASDSADEAEGWADKAEQAAADSGYMEFYIDNDGHLIMERTSNVDDIDFELINGHLILEVS